MPRRLSVVEYIQRILCPDRMDMSLDMIIPARRVVEGYTHLYNAFPGKHTVRFFGELPSDKYQGFPCQEYSNMEN